MYLFFDVETNGLPKKRNADPRQWHYFPRIIQLGFILYNNKNEIVQEYNKLIKPIDFTIPDVVSKLTGITTQKAMDEGIPIVQAINDFFDALEKTNVIVCHNFDFDYNVLLSEYFRNNIKRMSKKNRQKICTMKSSTDFCKIKSRFKKTKYKWPTLSELHTKLFNKDFENAHDAFADVKATADCFWKLVESKIIKFDSENVQEQKNTL